MIATIESTIGAGRARCTVLRDAGRQWDTENSSVISIPALKIETLAASIEPRNLTTSIVRVSGPASSPLHFHTSNVIGLVVHGTGTFHSASEQGEKVDAVVHQGDIVFIPRGAIHLFTTEEGGSMDYIALEWSDEAIDYQAHYTTESWD